MSMCFNVAIASLVCVVLEVQVREEMEKELEHLLKQKDDQVRMMDSFSKQ